MSFVLELHRLAVPGRLRPSDLSIAAGEFVGLIGPNGAGKTSLLRASLGLLPAEGRSNITELRIGARPRHVAYLAQERQLIWPIAVRDLVALGARAHPDVQGEGYAQADATLARLGLSDFRDRPVNSLSGGERARVLMARALAQNAPLLLADEPCAALDPAQAQSMARLLRAEAAAGRAVLASLHDLPLAARYCTRIVVMQGGAILADGAPDQILQPDLMAQVFAVGFARYDGADGPIWSVTELERSA